MVKFFLRFGRSHSEQRISTNFTVGITNPVLTLGPHPQTDRPILKPTYVRLPPRAGLHAYNFPPSKLLVANSQLKPQQLT